MANITIATYEQIKEDVVKVLSIDDTNAYDNQLEVTIKGAMGKLENEGVDNIFPYQSNDYYNYCMCIAYQVACDMDFDADEEILRIQYLARVNSLRLKCI